MGCRATAQVRVAGRGSRAGEQRNQGVGSRAGSVTGVNNPARKRERYRCGESGSSEGRVTAMLIAHWVFQMGFD